MEDDSNIQFHKKYGPMDLSISSLLQSLSICEDVTRNIITELEQLNGVISTHRGTVLKVKTSGTAITTLGTGLAVTGLILAPFTFGASLIVSSLGAVTTVGGAATNMIADLVDSFKRKKYLANIQKLADDQTTSKEELTQMLTHLQELIDPFLEQGLTKTEAIYATLISGDRSNSDTIHRDPTDSEFEWIEDMPPNWKQPVKRFAFKASIQSLKLVKSSHALSALTVAASAGRSAGGVVASTASNVSLGVGRLLGNVVIKTGLAAVGVIFTSIDIALLVREWKAKDPTGEAVTFVKEELTSELEQMEEFEVILGLVGETRAFLGRVGEMRVVGTSPFPVKAVVGLIGSGDGGSPKVNKFYGGIELEKERSIEFERFWVGGGYPGHDSGLAENNESTEKTETVFEISQIFPKSMDPERVEVPRIPVINQSVLNLHSTLIESFLASENLPKFHKLEKLFSKNNCQIVSDFYSPLPKNLVHNTTQVCVAYIKCPGEEEGYITANLWEYELVLELILKLLGQSFVKVFEMCGKESELFENEEDLEESDEISELVEVLINHKNYLDPVAYTVWVGGKGSGNENNVRIFVEIETAVQELFRNLRFKVRLWAWDIYEVKKLLSTDESK